MPRQTGATAVQLLLIFAAALFIYTWRLGDSPLDRTEPHRALVAHQMVQSGDWLIPHLFGEVYLRKPPLIYWAEGASELLWGRGNEFVWRFPSAFCSALLAVAMAIFAARWFGPTALLPAGIATLAIIALWEQDRGADIDALNTVAAVLSASVILEFLYGPTRRPWLWSAVLAVAIAATLLLKGPGGFPPILGAMIGPPLLLRDWKSLRRPALWSGLLAGIAIFVAYIITAKSHLAHLGIVPDTAGTQEALQRSLLHSIKDVLPALGAPFLTLIFALPISLAIPFSLMIRMEDLQRRRILAIIATIAAALVIWVLAGNKNPRYEYVALPLLAPLVGAVFNGLREKRFSSAAVATLRGIFVGFALIFLFLTLALSFKLWPTSLHHFSLVMACIVGIVACLFLSQFRLPAIATLALLMALSIPIGDRKNIERRKKSAKNTAAQLRQIVGSDGTVGVASMVRDMPELFYYSNLHIHAFGETHLADLAADPAPQWVVLSQNDRFPEYATISRQIPNAFPQGVTLLNMPDPRDKVYVGWFAPPPGTPWQVKLVPLKLDNGDRED